MVTRATLRLLCSHAGLEDDPDAADPSVSAATQAGAGVAEAVASYLRVLERLNHELNGAIPSAAAGGADEVPRAAAYAVAEVARMLRASGHGDAAWQVDTAWSAVLAGDVDDVLAHVAHERLARADG